MIVLISGENGVGKTVMAQALLEYHKKRRNCVKILEMTKENLEAAEDEIRAAVIEKRDLIVVQRGPVSLPVQPNLVIALTKI